MELMGPLRRSQPCLHSPTLAETSGPSVARFGKPPQFRVERKHVIERVEREVIVHRKGATPAGAGVLGIIPGSMASPGYVVSGKGNPESLNSASHGAGRA